MTALCPGPIATNIAQGARIALITALGSLAVTGVTVWGAVETIDWIDPATHT